MTLRAKLNWLCQQRISIPDYLVYSSVFSIYLQVNLVESIPTSFIGYLIIVPNFIILLVRRQIAVQRFHLFYLLMLTSVGLVAASRSGAPVTLVLSQIAGISFFSVYYYSLFSYVGMPLLRVMQIYARSALLIVLLAFAMYALHIQIFGDPRMHGILPEPSMFIITTLPAIAYYLLTATRQNWHLWQLTIFALGYILSGSTLGLMGVAITIIVVFGSRSPKYVPFALILTGVIFAGFYSLSEGVRVRVNDTLAGTLTPENGEVNYSTIAILTNVEVAVRSFETYPLIGIGFGAHRVAHDRFISELVPDADELPRGFQMNTGDASSLLLRVMSELGLFGVASLAAFFAIVSRVKGPEHILIRNALLPYFILKLARYGHYFPMEFYFFLMIFVVNFLEYRRDIPASASLRQRLQGPESKAPARAG